MITVEQQTQSIKRVAWSSDKALKDAELRNLSILTATEYNDYKESILDLIEQFKLSSQGSRYKVGKKTPLKCQQEKLDDGELVYVLSCHNIVGWVSIESNDPTKPNLHVQLMPNYAERTTLQSRMFSTFMYSQSDYGETLESMEAVENDEQVFDIIGWALSNALHAPLTYHGLPIGYTEVTEERESVEGRIVPEMMFPSMLITPHLIPQEISELSTNTFLSRLFHWCLDKLSGLVEHPKLIKEIDGLNRYFADIPSECPSSNELERFILPSTMLHYSDALNIAKMLAKGSGTDYGLTNDDLSLPGFVYSGYQIFEDYAGRIMEEALEGDKDLNVVINAQTRLEYTKNNSELKTLHTMIDFKIEDRSQQAVMALDAKYSEPLGNWLVGEVKQGNIPPPTNAYQVIASARVLGAKRAVIVMPSDSWDVEKKFKKADWMIEEPGCEPESIHLIFLRPGTCGNEEEHDKEVIRVRERIHEIKNFS